MSETDTVSVIVSEINSETDSVSEIVSGINSETDSVSGIFSEINSETNSNSDIVSEHSLHHNVVRTPTPESVIHMDEEHQRMCTFEKLMHSENLGSGGPAQNHEGRNTCKPHSKQLCYGVSTHVCRQWQTSYVVTRRVVSVTMACLLHDQIERPHLYFGL